MRRILVASRNPKKLVELRRVLAAAHVTGLEVVGLDEVAEYPETPETGATFEENALVKAQDGARATGLPCIADDSGLTVAALNGMPGVLSARWSGVHGDDAANTALLLAQMSDVPEERRQAAFVSCCVLVVPTDEYVDGEEGPEVNETAVHGEWHGAIARAPRGENGFGYDPVFVPAGEDRTAAQMSAEEKDADSHRARALAQLVPILRTLAEV
ncbi:RdgB/HAM1 family non-canonical purine NTP pyrophosphatase [Tomitella fengzijianii]|uniref:dITP/XTP pyrophosphatase n=1 Tax=Tomitella fengzijianii TaxID=2597660 RepID=A0A516X4W8_9ACTN|nr:RdgB/HAM1 family non-canonical purine NTP pyrophosphatase [Tomitella fengzijianii]QDQ98119.1 RdgB/HAM1 family non-canonical purine NTP pyrophosphatase [Tomitella fengzijianii]